MNRLENTKGSCTPRKRRQRKLQWTVIGAALLLAALCGPRIARAQATADASAAPQTTGPATDTEAIRAIIAKYAQAVDDADTNLAAQIWSASPDVTFIWPLGREHGFDQIKRDVYEAAMGGMFSERKLSIHDISVHVYGDTAWSEFDWDFTAKLKKDGSPVTTHGVETQIYRKEAAGWRLVHVHYSAMPAPQAAP
jgi:ketosteroid isomerase-like protein